MQRSVARIGGMVLVGWPFAAPAQTVAVPAPIRLAPAPPPAAPPASTPTVAGQTAVGEQGVLVYPAAFFASNNPNTALDMIVRLPGFTLDIGDVDSRGLAGNAGNVLIDGARPSSKSDTLDVVLQRINANAVARIELIRGGATGVDLRGRAVVANVILKPAPKTEIVLEPGAFLYTDGFIGPLLKGSYTRREGERQTEATLSATADRTGDTARGMRLRTDAAGRQVQRAGLDLVNHFYNVDARGAIQRPFAGGKLRANVVLDYTFRRDAQTISVASGSGADESTREDSSNPNAEAGFTYTRSPGPRTTIELTGLQRFNRVVYHGAFASGGSDTAFASTATTGESVLRATDTFRPSDKLSIEGGGEGVYNFLQNDSRFSVGGRAVALPNASIFVDELRGEGFGRATWHPTRKLTLEGELRVEVSRISARGDTSNARSFVYPKPRLLATWQPSEGNQLRARIEQRVGQLDFGDFAASTEITLGTVVGGNADLRPQRSTVFELAYEHRFWKKGVFTLTATHRELSDVVETIPLVGGFDAVGNIGDGTSDQVNTELTLPFEWIGIKDALLKLRGTLAWSSVTDPLTGERRRQAQTVPFDCDVQFTHDLKGGRFSYGFEHGCNVTRLRSFRSNESRTARFEPFVSIYGQYKPSNRLSLRVDLGNLINARSEGIRDIYTGPRNVAPLLFHEQRTTRRGQYVFFSVRRVL